MHRIAYLTVTAVLCLIGPMIAADFAQTTGGAVGAGDLPALIKALSGRWSLAVHSEPASAGGLALDSRGEETWRAGSGGLTAIEEEQVRLGGQDLSLFAVIWWDDRDHALHGMECNNHNPRGCDVRGALTDITLTWTAKEFVIEELETAADGRKSRWRETYSGITSNSFTQIGESGPPAGPFKRVVTMRATRVARADGR
jgi:hypothetical protein